MSSSNSGLPDGTEDFVGIKAEELENLRSLFLDFFYKNNCELVVPSLIESKYRNYCFNNYCNP